MQKTRATLEEIYLDILNLGGSHWRAVALSAATETEQRGTVSEELAEVRRKLAEADEDLRDIYLDIWLNARITSHLTAQHRFTW